MARRGGGVNWAHLKTFVWLRWRLAVNQIQRSGTLGVAVSMIFTALMVAGGVFGLLVGFFIGLVPLRTASPGAVMLVWDGAIVGFLVFWMAGLMAELQRSDALSLDRFLHLPVTPASAFFINFVGSSISLGLILFLPAMLGLSAGLLLSHGPWMLALFPLVAAFFLMVTAVTYQFRGWLASMMANPRRRRTIMALVPLLFFLMIQLPNLLNDRGAGPRARRPAADGGAARAENAASGYDVTRRANMVAPPGWLAYGAEAAAEGRVWPPLAGVLGMALIGGLSLRRAYGTTIRLYTGDFNTRRRRSPPSTIPATPLGRAPRAARSAPFLERRLPWVSDGASAVAMAGLRSWMRAPELKMMLLTPLLVLVVFTGMLRSGTTQELLRTLSVTGLVAFMLVLGMMGTVGNQFAFDRAGFRAFVLSPLPRRDVLLGKNLSVFPYAVVVTVAVVAVSQWFGPMRIDHLGGVLVQAITMCLVICVAGNLLSIVGPMALRPGSGMPAPNQGIRQVYPLVFMVLIPIPLGLTLLPLGIESLLVLTGRLPWFPAYLVLGAVQAVVAVWLYRIVLDWQGELLHRRERQILDIVSSRTG
jgi:hypothetical protein